MIPNELIQLDITLVPYINKIIADQKKHIARLSNKRYFQRFPTHLSFDIPEVGKPKRPRHLGVDPQRYRWTGIKSTDELPASFYVEEYEGPKGIGFTIVAEVMLNGDKWRKGYDCDKRGLGHGPNKRGFEWEKFIPIEEMP